MEAAGEVLIVAGSTIIALAALGVVRFRSFPERIHPTTKGSTLGILLVALGAALALGTWNTTTKLAVIGLSFLVTAPVAGHLLGRAAYHATGQLQEVDSVDELARDLDKD